MCCTRNNLKISAVLKGNVQYAKKRIWKCHFYNVEICIYFGKYFILVLNKGLHEKYVGYVSF